MTEYIVKKLVCKLINVQYSAIIMYKEKEGLQCQ